MTARPAVLMLCALAVAGCEPSAGGAEPDVVPPPEDRKVTTIYPGSFMVKGPLDEGTWCAAGLHAREVYGLGDEAPLYLGGVAEDRFVASDPRGSWREIPWGGAVFYIGSADQRITERFSTPPETRSVGAALKTCT